MKLINNRFKIKNLIVTEEYEEGYLVLDLSNNNKKSMLKLYDYEKNANVIKYYIDNFIEISQIRHKNLLASYSFNIVESINLKKTNIPLYYSVVEYLERPVFRSNDLDLNFEETLKIILDLMGVIDFLHFRGYVYEYLNPINTFYNSQKTVKIVDLSTISEYKINAYYYDDYLESFSAPETFINVNNSDYRSDYYSLGMMMKYLLLENHICDIGNFKYKENLGLNNIQKEYLNQIIINLTHKEPDLRNIKIRTHIDNIIEFFNHDYFYNLSEERGNFHSKTKIIGRDKEINRLLNLNSKIDSQDNFYDIGIVSGNEGDGKTKLLSELTYKLKMEGKNVYFLDVKENNINNIGNLSFLIKETMKNISTEISNKYSEELKVFTEIESKIQLENTRLEVEKFKNLNKLSNYFKNISKSNKTFIIIDNFHKIKDDFIFELDYIINNIENNEISTIIGYETNYSVNNSEILDYINKWKVNNKVIEIKLDKLNEEDIGKLTKSILGISYIPKRFSSILFKGSQGNPLYLDYIIKYLFNKGELYINKSGNWGLKTEDYSNLPIPSNINKAIEEQLKNITSEDLNVLKVISAFTDKFTKQILIDILDFKSISLEKSLSRLIMERFIEKHDEMNYSIITNGWQRIIYSRINSIEKAELHGKIAEIIIEHRENQREFVLEELLCHLVKSKDHNKTLDFIFQEWKTLENKYSEKSIYLCEEAYKLTSSYSNKEKLVILDRLTDIYSVKGNLEKSDKYLSQLRLEAELQNNLEFLIKSMVYEASEYLRANNSEKALEIANKIELLSSENNISEGIIEALIMKCRIGLDDSNLSYIKNFLYEARDLSYKIESEKYLGTIFNLLGFLNHLEGNTSIAILNYKESIEHSINNNDMLEATKPMNNLGEIYSVNHGNIDMALYYYNRGLEIANNYGATQSSIIFMNNLGELYKNSVDMKKALELFEHSRQGAIDTGDFKMIFLINANLGSLYVSYNMLDKAYDCFVFLEREYKSNPIMEIEILIQYFMFKAEYYEAFGEVDLAIDYFEKVIYASKGHNNRDFLRAKMKVVLIQYQKSSSIDRLEVMSLIAELYDAKLFYDRQKFLLYLSIMLHLNKDDMLGNEFLNIYDVDDNKIKLDPVLLELRKCLSLLLLDTNDSLEEIENIITNSKNLKIYNIDLYIYTVLGKIYFRKNNYYKAIKNLLRSLNSIYKTGQSITKVCLYQKYINTRHGDRIKNYIIQILEKILPKEIQYKLETSFDLNKLINDLPEDVFNKIFYNKLKTENMGSIQELITNLSEDYEKNLEHILHYIGLITLADRGHIIQFDETINEYKSIASILEDDFEMPNESILIQSNKSKLGLLLNKNLEDMAKSKYFHYLPHNTVGIICLPINIPYKSKEVDKDRRKRIYSSSHNNKGYIYIESSGSLNRFDLERLKVINSLSYLIYLNMENNALKLVSSIDKLTGAFTRKYFDLKIEEILKNLNKSDESLSVLMLDIDNFKSVNDTYGHIKGDEVLSYVSKTIKSTVRNTDLVARFGGEEFVVLLTDSNINLGKHIGEKIRKNIENMKIEGINRPVTVSIGIAQYPDQSQYKEDLINKADQALYYSKNYLGKNSSAIWNVEMGNSYNKMDKLAGILTGNTNLDNRNVLTVLDMVELGIKSLTFKEKVHFFLGRTLDTIDGEYATLLLLDEDQKPIPYGSRIRLDSSWVKTPKINMDKILEIIKKAEGEYIIDWDDIESICPITGVPNWQSIIIIPLVNRHGVEGIIYISVPLIEKEFDFNSFNLTKLLCNIFASNL